MVAIRIENEIVALPSQRIQIQGETFTVRFGEPPAQPPLTVLIDGDEPGPAMLAAQMRAMVLLDEADD